VNAKAAAGAAAGDRRLVEDAVSLLLNEAPTGWTQLHVEFDSDTASATASVSTPVVSGVGHIALPVPAGAVEALREHHRRAAAGGELWRRLVIDCDVDGRLSARTDPITAGATRRWAQRVVAAITLGCLAAAAVVFTIEWRWSPPPRAAMIPVPPPSARQQQVFEVMKRWYDAENRGDGPALRKLACVRPGKYVEDEIEGFEQTPGTDGIAYLAAVSDFRDEGARVWARFAMRVHPLSERQRRLSDETQRKGGYFFDEYTFVQEGGELKVCDADRPPLQ
jgi:hypothetical protein